MSNIIYVSSVISTGLFAGLMMTLVFLLQRQWMRQTKNEYAANFKQFLLAAKGHPLITLLSFVSFIGPFYLATQASAGAITLYTSSLVFFLGCFVVTVFLNLPIYRQVIAWKTAADASRWKSIRMRFFALNVIRSTSALAALVLLLVAQIS